VFSLLKAGDYPMFNIVEYFVDVLFSICDVGQTLGTRTFYSLRTLIHFDVSGIVETGVVQILHQLV
jgi:hypothetical protein